MYYPFVCKVFFQFDPEHAHKATSQQLRRVIGTPLEMLVRRKIPARPVTCIGLISKNPLGLTTGLDKSGECTDTLGAIGFGSIEIGTVTPRPQPGSDKSKIFRLVGAGGSINRMGFNNHGVDDLVENTKKAHFDGVPDINIDKNKDISMEHGKDDYPICMEKAYPYAGYIAINISSPNTLGLRMLQYGEALDDLLSGIKNKQLELQQKHQKYVPIAAEIAPDLLPEGLTQVADSLVRHNIDGVTATNTALDRSLVQGMEHCNETGGLSDRPLQLKDIEVIRTLSAELNGRLPVINVGGIDSVTVAREKIAAGALLVQIYSGLISKGPPLTKEIVTHI